MDNDRFDRLAAALADAPSRRGLLRLISWSSLLAIFGRLDLDEAVAKKKGKKKKCKRGKKKCGKTCIPKANCCTSRQCPEGEICRNGECTNCVTADDCPTSDTACQGPVCRNGRCAKAQLPAGSNCFTGDFCVGNETCDAEGVCGGGIPRVCDDGIVCTDDSCDESINECVHEANDSHCATDNPCVVGRCDPEDEASDENGCVFDPIPGDGGTLTCGVGACFRTVPRCVDGEEQDCVPGQPSSEICNGIDDDCDGIVDEGACSVDPPSTCGSNGVCAGGTCQNYGTQTVCQPASCVGTTLQPAAKCDGNGSCVAPQTQSCAPFKCHSNGTTCIGSCGGDGDCVPDHFCGGGVCRPKRSNGEECQLHSQCASNFCFNGTCQPKRANGEECSDPFQCESGICVANVCCATSCDVSQSCVGGTCQG